MGLLIPLPDRDASPPFPADEKGAAHGASGGGKAFKIVYFTHAELRLILGVYASRVVIGEWRDYAIDHRVGAAEFSIFRTTHESPVFKIVKRNGKPREYSVMAGRETLNRGRVLADVLKVFKHPLTCVK